MNGVRMTIQRCIQNRLHQYCGAGDHISERPVKPPRLPVSSIDTHSPWWTKVTETALLSVISGEIRPSMTAWSTTLLIQLIVDKRLAKEVHHDSDQWTDFTLDALTTKVMDSTANILLECPWLLHHSPAISWSTEVLAWEDNCFQREAGSVLFLSVLL